MPLPHWRVGAPIRGCMCGKVFLVRGLRASVGPEGRTLCCFDLKPCPRSSWGCTRERVSVRRWEKAEGGAERKGGVGTAPYHDMGNVAVPYVAAEERNGSGNIGELASQ